MRPWSYEGRWALVTGASAGIGEVFAEKLASRGMNLVLTARRVDRLEQLAERLIGSAGIEVITVPGDLAREGEPDRIWKAATAKQPIDLLVNNAGFGIQRPFHEVGIDRHLELLRLNCIALTELAHFALADMRPRGDGAIINVSSIAAFQPVPRLASYAASKAYVLSLSEALWAENSDAGIRVLALCPGRTPTEFQEVAGTGSAEGAFGYRTPEQVVDAALRALERGRPTVVPGIENAAATWATRALPRSFVAGVLKRIAGILWRNDPARV